MVIKPKLEIPIDNTKFFNRVVDRFKLDAVLVGIPETAGTRNPDESDADTTISNAMLLFINNFGSPINNIPPRPVMQIGIKAAQPEIEDQFKKCAQSAFKDGVSAIDVYYQRAGFIASNSIKRTINNQTDIDEPANSTIRSREAQGFKGKKALVVTGQMRNAITFVYRKGGF